MYALIWQVIENNGCNWPTLDWYSHTATRMAITVIFTFYAAIGGWGARQPILASVFHLVLIFAKLFSYEAASKWMIMPSERQAYHVKICRVTKFFMAWRQRVFPWQSRPGIFKVAPGKGYESEFDFWGGAWVGWDIRSHIYAGEQL